MDKRSLKIRSLKSSEASDHSSSSSSDYNWRKSVIDDYHFTNRLWRNVLNESRTSRIRLEKSCEEIRKVINIWNDYGDRFRESVHNLSIRIEDNDREEEEKKHRVELLKQRRFRIARPTKLSRWRMREKFIPVPTLPPFKFL